LGPKSRSFFRSDEGLQHKNVKKTSFLGPEIALFRPFSPFLGFFAFLALFSPFFEFKTRLRQAFVEKKEEWFFLMQELVEMLLSP